MGAKLFTVRCNIEYSLTLEADTEDAAMALAEKRPLDEWMKAESPYEAEEEELP